MQSKATTVKKYLAELPADRRQALEQVRAVILKNLPKGYEEGMQYGMIGYYVPHTLYPPGYHCNPKEPLPFASLASQKNHMAIYLMCIYAMEDHREWFCDAWIKTGKKLDMGKGCVRFKKIEDVPLNVVGQAIKRVSVKKHIEHYESIIKPGGKRPTKKAASKKKTSKKKTATRSKKTTARSAKSPTKKKASSRKIISRKK